MISDIDIRYSCNDALESIGDKEIARYCYEKGMMTKEQALEVLGNEEELHKHKNKCYIWVDIDSVLGSIGDDDLYDWLNDNGYDSPKNQQEDFEFDKYTWLKGIRDIFSKMFTKIYTKEDFKKEICDAIDCYL